MKATDATGVLVPIPNFYLKVGTRIMSPRMIPTNINDTKSATYQNEGIPGRTTPIKYYTGSEPRIISFNWPFFMSNEITKKEAIDYLKIFKSLVYPRSSTTAAYAPPTICKFKCGQITENQELCVILTNYSLGFGNTTVWDAELLPISFEVGLNFEVVYASSNLPGSEKMIL